MNKRRLIFLSAFTLLLGFFIFKDHFKSQKQGITLVLPIEHQALTDMAEGFSHEIRSKLKDQSYDLRIMNAMGDRHVMHTMIEQARRREDAVVVTIGTELTLMAMRIVKTIPLVGLDVTTEVNHSQDNVTGVYEAQVEPGFEFMMDVLKNPQKITLLYSPTDKIEKQIQSLEHVAKVRGVMLQKIMVQTLADLYTLSSHVDGDTKALFILKDHLLASGAATLKLIADKKNIPFVSCDEGSVHIGAAFALGNTESDIGKQGATLALDILDGKEPRELGMKHANQFQVFYNPVSLTSQGVELSQLEAAAKKHGYSLSMKG